MLKVTLNSSPQLIRTNKLYSCGDELSIVYCIMSMMLRTDHIVRKETKYQLKILVLWKRISKNNTYSFVSLAWPSEYLHVYIRKLNPFLMSCETKPFKNTMVPVWIKKCMMDTFARWYQLFSKQFELLCDQSYLVFWAPYLCELISLTKILLFLFLQASTSRLPLEGRCLQENRIVCSCSNNYLHTSISNTEERAFVVMQFNFCASCLNIYRLPSISDAW